MRIGSLARSQTRFVALLVAAAATAILPLATFGQSRYASYESNGSPVNQGPVQALYTAPDEGATAGPASRYVDSYGNPLIVPAGYCEPCAECGGQCGGCAQCGTAPMAGGGFTGPFPMGAGGTDPPNGYDLMADTGMEGDLVDQRGPHYFDFRAETVFLRRDKTFEQNIDFSAQNVGNVVVLSSNQLNLEDTSWGFRMMGRYDIGPVSVVEFGYMGIFDWNTSASYTDPTNNLFSLFSRPAPGTGLFGTSPVPPATPIGQGVNDPGGANPQSERAHTHSISLESDLQTAEISYRRYWLGYTPRVSGTLLAGFRYTKVNEEFQFHTQGSEPLPNTTGPLAALRYGEDCENNLAGFQTGGDIWVSLMQGLRVGSEGKVGIYNNHSKLNNRIATTPAGTTPPTLFEEFTDDHAAFISEASVDVVADILPSVSLRAGYEVLFLNQLVLAGDNFNQTSPYGNQGTRVPFVNDNGELFYHGGHFGIEYIW